MLLNVECGADTISEIDTAFRYNDAVLRSLIIKRDNAVTEETQFLKEERADRAERLCALQKKVSELFGIPLPDPESEPKP